MSDQKYLFDGVFDENDWREEWREMPEYINTIQPEPVITATFKFRTKEDYDDFHSIVKKALYDGHKVFDGMQRKDKKNAWYPLPEKASRYLYE